MMTSAKFVRVRSALSFVCVNSTIATELSMEPPGPGCYANRMSRQMNKERTRRRLLQAILKTIHRYGHGALTTGRVAQLAGVAQPTFYVHFRSMDQALEEVAESVARELGTEFDPGATEQAERAADELQEAVFKCTRSLVRDRTAAAVFLSSTQRMSGWAVPQGF